VNKWCILPINLKKYNIFTAMKKNLLIRFNQYIITIIALVFMCGFFSFRYWEINILSGDAWGYYSYLPATFIYDDIGTYNKTVKATQKYKSFPDPLTDKYGLYHAHPITHKNVVKYTSGLAILLSPFFFIAHFLAGILNFQQDGFSEIYRFCMGVGMILWVLVGLYFLLNLLQKYYSKSASYLTIIALSLCTNLYYNTALNSIMSHALLFSLYSILIYATCKFYENPNFKKAVIIGLISGFITLTRMTELYCILIPLLWNFQSTKEKYTFLKSNFKYIGAATIFFLLPFMYQFFYWKTLTGQFIFNGYIGESFNFLSPKIKEGLFSFDNGWLPWSPIMIISLMGIFFIKKYTPQIFHITLTLVPIHIYVIYSWWCYNYINGFGSRPMEHMYPILSFSMAAFFCTITKSTFGKFISISIIILTGSLNIFQNYQFTKEILNTSYASSAYYISTLGAMESNESILITRSTREIQPTDTKLISNIFTIIGKENSQNIDPIQIDKNIKTYSEQSTILYYFNSESLKKGDYVKINCQIKYPSGTKKIAELWDMPLLYIQWRDKEDKNIRNYDTGVYPFQFIENPNFSIYNYGKPDVWGNVSFYVKIPKSKMTKGVLGIWNPNKIKFFVKDFNLELHKS
jgi:hypothetical protein